MDLEGAFLDLKGALVHSLPKSGGAIAPLALWFLRPCNYVMMFMLRDMSMSLHIPTPRNHLISIKFMSSYTNMLSSFYIILCLNISCIHLYIVIKYHETDQGTDQQHKITNF